MSHKLPAYMRPSSSPAYHSINDEYNNGTALLASKKSKNTTPTRIAVILFLATFILICGRWVKSHPSFLEDIRIARTLAVNAHITLYPTIESYNVQTSQELPVPKVNASILGVPNTPKWKTIAAARIPAYPRKIVPGPSAPSTDEILFAIATTAERAISRAQWGLWPSFLTNPSSPCFVLLPPEDADRTTKVIAKLKEIGLNCIVKASQQKKYQIRVLALPREAMEAWQDRSNHIKWLIMGDDDTLWLDKNGLLRMLGQHDEREMKFIASTSERIESLGWFGRMTFGGGGLIMSSALVEKYIKVLPDCEQRWPTTFGGDEAVNNCAALAQGIDSRDQAYLPEAGLHQFDVYGHASGFVESGLPMMTWHHFFSWSKVMPEWMHRNDDYKMLNVVLQAAHFLGQDNMFKRYSLDNGRTILVNGYSITNYYEALTPEELGKMEWTWSHAPDCKLINENVRPPITPIGHPPSKYDQQGSQRKSPYFLEEVREVDPSVGRATFVYRNERGKKIIVDWVEKSVW